MLSLQGRVPHWRSSALLLCLLMMSSAALQRPGAHSFDLTFYMYRLLEMSDKHRVRLRLVDVPQDADFGARCLSSSRDDHFFMFLGCGPSHMQCLIAFTRWRIMCLMNKLLLLLLFAFMQAWIEDSATISRCRRHDARHRVICFHHWRYSAPRLHLQLRDLGALKAQHLPLHWCLFAVCDDDERVKSYLDGHAA